MVFCLNKSHRLNPSEQILQFIRTFKAHVPVRNPGDPGRYNLLYIYMFNWSFPICTCELWNMLEFQAISGRPILPLLSGSQYAFGACCRRWWSVCLYQSSAYWLVRDNPCLSYLLPGVNKTTHEKLDLEVARWGMNGTGDKSHKARDL